MGNRAVITTKRKDLGLYLHWNGGRDSVNGFLAYARMRDYISPENDSYGWAYLCQIIANFFGDGYSVGISRFECLGSQGDNGIYIIEDWKIVGREDYNHAEQNEYDLLEFMIHLDSKMPNPSGEDAIKKWVAEHGEEYN